MYLVKEAINYTVLTPERRKGVGGHTIGTFEIGFHILAPSTYLVRGVLFLLCFPKIKGD